MNIAHIFTPWSKSYCANAPMAGAIFQRGQAERGRGGTGRKGCLRDAARLSGCCLLLCILLLPLSSAQAGQPFPDLKLPAHPQAAALGLPDSAFFLSELEADVLLINVYSWFCGPCQQEAPLLAMLNAEIYKLGLDNRVLLLGIAAGDTPDLVDKFRDKHQIKFALFADPDMELYSKLGNLPVPALHVVVKGSAGLERRELLLGRFTEDPREFLRRIAVLP
ncbi:TlpA disulfide reductase family protein [Oleidesulfovibrio sp.]|uniref:TlpA disulfide reductase family protein n=1 Tax=Oleidesulfovibrio sp. TaxID=2909707 RepID=UPI003A8A3346